MTFTTRLPLFTSSNIARLLINAYIGVLVVMGGALRGIRLHWGMWCTFLLAGGLEWEIGHLVSSVLVRYCLIGWGLNTNRGGDIFVGTIPRCCDAKSEGIFGYAKGKAGG